MKIVENGFDGRLIHPDFQVICNLIENLNNKETLEYVTIF